METRNFCSIFMLRLRSIALSSSKVRYPDLLKSNLVKSFLSRNSSCVPFDCWISLCLMSLVISKAINNTITFNLFLTNRGMIVFSNTPKVLKLLNKGLFWCNWQTNIFVKLNELLFSNVRLDAFINFLQESFLLLFLSQVTSCS